MRIRSVELSAQSDDTKILITKNTIPFRSFLYRVVHASETESFRKFRLRNRTVPQRLPNDLLAEPYRSAKSFRRNPSGPSHFPPFRESLQQTPAEHTRSAESDSKDLSRTNLFSSPDAFYLTFMRATHGLRIWMRKRSLRNVLIPLSRTKTQVGLFRIGLAERLGSRNGVCKEDADQPSSAATLDAFLSEKLQDLGQFRSTTDRLPDSWAARRGHLLGAEQLLALGFEETAEKEPRNATCGT